MVGVRVVTGSRMPSGITWRVRIMVRVRVRVSIWVLGFTLESPGVPGLGFRVLLGLGIDLGL